MWRTISYLFTILFFIVSAFNVVAADLKLESENVISIDGKQSFGFPEKKFLHPLVSPDDKWVVYHRTDIDWRRQKLSDFLFGRTRDIVFKKIFYSEVGRSDKKVVPLPRPKQGSQDRFVGTNKKWSPDGKILAYRVEEDPSGDGIILVDFSKKKPILIESLGSPSFTEFYFVASDELLYIAGKYLMIKKIGSPPIKVLNFIGTYPSFQVGSNGTILYRSKIERKMVVHMDNFINPSNKPKPIFQNPSFDLSPTGNFAVFYSKNMYSKDTYRTEDQLALLIDLDKQNIIYKFIVKKDYRVRWSPDGNKIAFLGEDIEQKEKRDVHVGRSYHSLVIMNIINMKIKTYLYLGNSSKLPITWTPDGDHIICRYYQRGLFIIRAKDGKQIGQLGGIRNRPGDNVTITPSGKYLYWSDLDTYTFFVIKNPFQIKMLN